MLAATVLRPQSGHEQRWLRRIAQERGKLSTWLPAHVPAGGPAREGNSTK